MKQSESIENLAKALTALQAELPIIPFDSVNPYYNSNYASLKAILGVVRPLLVKHDLTVTQLPSSPYPNPLEVSTITATVPNAPSTSRAFALTGLSTRLIHSSGEWIEDEVHIPIEADQRVAQVVGGIITYLRRYALSAMLGIVADEDTDGNEPPKGKKAQPKAKAPSNNGQKNGNGKKLMSSQKFVEYVYEKLGFKNPQHVRATMKLLGKKAVPQDIDLRKTLYEALEAYRDMRDVKKLSQDDALAALQDEPKETTAGA